MSDPVHDLYQTSAYPAMSHPLSDPAVSAVAARLSGLQTAHPSQARILEIGCCSGHNLIPLAVRWPGARFTGIDLAASSIREAREKAAEAGVGNIDFQAADLRDFRPVGGPFDFIIAHGFLSWVPDDVKAALFHFCREYLVPSGIATISFNLECGWAARFPVIRKTCAIQQARGEDLVTSLEILRMVTDADSPEIAIIDDMLAKGPAILAFDDFGPVNDPWPLDRFVGTAVDAGLCWLGESDPTTNLPAGLDGEALREARARSTDFVEFQMALDVASGRTFRSCVLCRNDVSLEVRPDPRMVFDWSIRCGPEPAGFRELEVWREIHRFSPTCVPARRVFESLSDWDEGEFVTMVLTGIRSGWILPRIEAVAYDPELREFPSLDAFRLLCARKGLPLVDAWHKPCLFPENHYAVLAAMDGSRDRATLAAFSRDHCPELAFQPWLRHLAARGMFS